MEVDVEVPLGKGRQNRFLKKKLMNKLQIRWDTSNTGRWCYSITHTVWSINCLGENRKEEVLLARLRLGHTVEINTGTCGFT